MAFGIAKHWESGSSAGLTVPGKIIGTPEHMTRVGGGAPSSASGPRP